MTAYICERFCSKCAAIASKLSSVTNFCPLVTTVTAESVVSSSHLKSGVESSESVLASVPHAIAKACWNVAPVAVPVL